MPLCAPHTMVSVDGGATSFYREGFILTLYFEDGSFGLGEVCLIFLYLLHFCTCDYYMTIHDLH